METAETIIAGMNVVVWVLALGPWILVAFLHSFEAALEWNCRLSGGTIEYTSRAPYSDTQRCTHL